MRNAVVLCAGLLTLMLPSVAMAQAQAPAQGQGMMPFGGQSVRDDQWTVPARRRDDRADGVVQRLRRNRHDQRHPEREERRRHVRHRRRLPHQPLRHRHRLHTFKSTNSASISGSIPHPIFFDQPRTVSSTLDGLEHTEHVVHLQAYYFVPVARKMDVGVFIGPSFFSVRQDYVTGLNAFTESSNFETVSIPAGRGHGQGLARGIQHRRRADLFDYAERRGRLPAALQQGECGPRVRWCDPLDESRQRPGRRAAFGCASSEAELKTVAAPGRVIRL